jgi:hypothetical protein
MHEQDFALTLMGYNPAERLKKINLLQQLPEEELNLVGLMLRYVQYDH